LFNEKKQLKSQLLDNLNTIPLSQKPNFIENNESFVLKDYSKLHKIVAEQEKLIKGVSLFN
jgi:hypothetical protein